MFSQSILRRLIPAAWVPGAKAAYYKCFRMSLRPRCWFADRFATPDLELPLPPALLRFRVCESLDAGEFLRMGAHCGELICQQTKMMGADLLSAQRVLDFGCGCGRTIRWLLRPGKPDFFGVDVDSAAIQWCQRYLPAGYFTTTLPRPPLPYAENYFDVVYGLSVFTHLDEGMQDLWLPELNRVLKPGGLLVLSVHGPTAAEGLDPDGIRILQTQGLLHRRSFKLKGLLPDWYHTTWHGRDYITNRVANCFEDVHYTSIPGGVQDFVAARKMPRDA